MVVIILGSKSDLSWGNGIAKYLAAFVISCKIHIASAHKTPQYLLSLIAKYKSLKKPLVYICVAGRSNAFGGFVYAQTVYPVVNCPPYSERYKGLDVLSSLRMPSGVGCVTVISQEAAALAAAKILAGNDKKLARKILDYQEKNRKKIIDGDRAL